MIWRRWRTVSRKSSTAFEATGLGGIFSIALAGEPSAASSVGGEDLSMIMRSAYPRDDLIGEE